jgi:CelD/BcsL family acetyltransferase involved in cellulose biosynthesis
LQRRWLRLWIQELDGAPPAAWYGFRFDGVEAYYQAGRDPSFDRESVGFVLLAHSIRAAFDDGVREYRLLRGDDPYKSRFASADRPLQTVALSSGIRGRAAVAAASSLRASTTLRRSLRQRLGA